MFKTIEQFTAAYERRSIEDCMACMASDAKVMAYGTNADEKRVGPAAIRDQFTQDWAQTSTASMQLAWHHEMEHGDTGWVAADLKYRFETAAGVDESDGRASFVMVRESNGKWLIEHMHFSVPAKLAVNPSRD